QRCAGLTAYCSAGGEDHFLSSSPKTLRHLEGPGSLGAFFLRLRNFAGRFPSALAVPWPRTTGAASYPNKSPGALPWTSGWTVGTERTRPQPQARPQRGRDVVQRRAAVAAPLRLGSVDSQPLPPRPAFRVDALHRPSG